MNEEIVTFGRTRPLVGILHQPEPSAVQPDLPVVLLLNAGILHRVGPNRLYVRIARVLAESGFQVLRFDLGGIGDSQDLAAAKRSASFFDDTQEAMEMLRQRAGARRFMLMGICMGARIALEVASRDARVDSLVLMEGIYVKSARYHISRMLDLRKWARVLTGRNHKMKTLRKAVTRRVGRVMGRARPAEVRSSRPLVLSEDSASRNMRETLQALLGRGTKILLAFRDGNEIAHNYRLRREGDEMTAVGLPNGLQVSFVRFADHTFTPLISQQLLLQITMKWIADTHLRRRAPLKVAA